MQPVPFNVITNYRETFELAKLDKTDNYVSVDEIEEKELDGKSKPSTQNMTTLSNENELPVLIGNNRVARIPFPMTEDDYDLLIGTLNLWKKKIVKPSDPTAQ